MPIAVKCPGCQAALKAPDTLAGKRVKCPKCQGVIPVPAPAPVAEEAPAPAPAPVVKPRTRRSVVPVRRKSKSGLVVGIVVGLLVLGGGAFAAWWFLLSDPTPSLLKEAPDGMMVQYFTRSGAEALSGEPRKSLPKNFNSAVLVMGEKFEFLVIAEGTFDVAAEEADLKKDGYAKETVEGYELWLNKAVFEMAAYVSKTRIISGVKKSVIDALQVRDGKKKNLLDGLTSEQRSLLRKMPRNPDYFLLAKNTKNPMTGESADATFQVMSGRKTGAREITGTMITVFKDAATREKNEKELEKGERGMKVLKKTASGNTLTVEIKTDFSDEK